MNVTEIIEQILSWTEKKNQADRELKKLKASFKSYATKNEICSIAGGGKWYNRHWVSKPVLNEERITVMFQNKGLEVDSGKSLKWDEQKLLALVTLGVVTEDELMSCYDDNGYEKWQFADESILSEHVKAKEDD